MSIEQKRAEFLKCEADRAEIHAQYVVAKAESDRLHALLLRAADFSYQAEAALIAISLGTSR